MRVVVLGSAAGGGFPQWNSNGEGCRRARAGDPAAKPRSQASLAVSADGQSWYLVNASPDLREQIGRTPDIQSRGALRSSPIKGVILTGGEVDTVAGLLTLREGQPLDILAPRSVHAILDANPIFDVLSPEKVRRIPVELDGEISLPAAGSAGLSLTLFTVPGKVPLYLERGPAPEATSDDSTVGVRLSDGADELFFIPGCAAMTPALRQRLRGAACVLFDGTLWRDDEMLLAGAGPKTGKRMGHMSVSGPDGVIASFEGLGVSRKILIHINNTNPILMEDSAEHASVRAAGWEVAWDGMEVFA